MIQEITSIITSHPMVEAGDKSTKFVWLLYKMAEGSSTDTLSRIYY